MRVCVLTRPRSTHRILAPHLLIFLLLSCPLPLLKSPPLLLLCSSAAPSPPQLDFLVVSLAWLPILIPAFGHYSVLRAFRALRPLRALRRMPGMPVLVQWILDVMPKMARCINACSLQVEALT